MAFYKCIYALFQSCQDQITYLICLHGFGSTIHGFDISFFSNIIFSANVKSYVWNIICIMAFLTNNQLQSQRTDCNLV